MKRYVKDNVSRIFMSLPKQYVLVHSLRLILTTPLNVLF